MAEATKLTLEKQQVLEKLEEITHTIGYKCLMCYKDAGVPDHNCTGPLCRVEGNRGTTDQYVEDVKDGGVAKDMYNSYYQICTTHMPQWKKTKDLHARMAASRLENQEREKQRLIEQREACERRKRANNKIHMDNCYDCISLQLMTASSIDLKM
jgi:hypothetical protein